MTENEIVTMLSDTLGAVVVPEPLLNRDDPEVQAWRDWNRSKPPIDLSQLRTTEKTKRLARKARRKGVAA